MTEETEGLYEASLLIPFIIGILALICFATKKNVVKDALYSIGRFIVMLLIGYFIQEPYDKYFFTLIGGVCLATFPAFHFCLMEISQGRLKWVATEVSALPKNEKKREYAVTGNDACIEIEQTASLKEKGILSEEEFNEQKKKLLKI